MQCITIAINHQMRRQDFFPKKGMHNVQIFADFCHATVWSWLFIRIIQLTNFTTVSFWISYFFNLLKLSWRFQANEIVASNFCVPHLSTVNIITWHKEKFSTRKINFQFKKKQRLIWIQINFKAKETSTPASLGFETQFLLFGSWGNYKASFSVIPVLPRESLNVCFSSDRRMCFAGIVNITSKRSIRTNKSTFVFTHITCWIRANDQSLRFKTVLSRKETDIFLFLFGN